jgi:hypothetical protein
MKKLILLVSIIISIYANDDLKEQRAEELKRYSNSMNIKGLSDNCKIALKNIIEKTIDYDMAFDNNMKYKTKEFSMKVKEMEDDVKKSKTYFMAICTDSDLELIKKNR